MALKFTNWSRGSVRERAAQQWASLSDSLRKGGRPPSKPLRDEAAKLYRDVGKFLQLSDPRAVRAHAALGLMEVHPGTDWRWRPGLFFGPVTPAGLVEPESGRKLGNEVAIWHDCPHHALILRQIANLGTNHSAPFGLRLEAMGFAGQYLSLSLDLPESVLEWLGKSHILRLETEFQAEMPITVYGRLNLLQGPNTEQLLRQLGEPVTDVACHRAVEFDLAYVDLSARPIEKVWLDLIFASPYMNAVTLSDMVLSRRPRAEV